MPNTMVTRNEVTAAGNALLNGTGNGHLTSNAVRLQAAAIYAQQGGEGPKASRATAQRKAAGRALLEGHLPDGFVLLY